MSSLQLVGHFVLEDDRRLCSGKRTLGAVGNPIGNGSFPGGILTSGKSIIFLFTYKQSNECCESNTPLAKWEGEIEFLTIGSGASG